MTDVNQKIRVAGALTTLEDIQDVELLRTMYKKLNETHADAQRRNAALSYDLRSIRDACNVLASQTYLDKVVNDLKNTFDVYSDFVESLATALQAQEAQIHTLSERLDKIEHPVLFEAAQRAQRERG